MPGGQWPTFRSGADAERLAEYLLGRIAFVTAVPRKEDVGHDLFASLIEETQKFLKPRGFFAMQVKANKKKIVYEEKHEVEWIVSQHNPFFIGVADIKSHRLEVYSTWIRLKAFLFKTPPKVVLHPREPAAGVEVVDYARDESKVDIYLGKPVISISAGDLADTERVQSRREILQRWVELDNENIVRVASKMYWVLGPTEYETNQPIPERDSLQPFFFWNVENLNSCAENYVKSSIALVKVLQKAEEMGRNTAALQKSIGDVYRNNWDSLGELAKSHLIGFGLIDPESLMK